jgi:hypothetical protein
MIKLAHQLHERTPDYARLGFSSLSVLPAGDTYPVFSEYPTGSVELQQLERQRIQEAEEALIRRRQVSPCTATHACAVYACLPHAFSMTIKTAQTTSHTELACSLH